MKYKKRKNSKPEQESSKNVEEVLDKAEKVVKQLQKQHTENEQKVLKFRSLNYSDNDIASMLEIPVDIVKEIK